MIFTDDQCDSFNAYQAAGIMHPFTCGNNHDGERELVARADGLFCPTCDYVQDWAHGWQLDWSWKDSDVYAAMQFLKKGATKSE